VAEDVVSLLGDRARVVVAPPLVAVEAPGRTDRGVVVAGAPVLDLLVVLDAGLEGARCTTGRCAPRPVGGHALPAAPVERHAEPQLRGRDAGVDVRLDSLVDAEPLRCGPWVGWVVVQVDLVPGQSRAPGTPEVIALDVAEVEGVEDLRVVPATRRDVSRVRRQERAERVVLPGLRAVRVELRAELLQQQLEVAGVVGRVDVVALETVVAPRPLPVDVDPLEVPAAAPGPPRPSITGRLPLM
jgi:hypothetical protein